jgi:hypothetical protein
MQSFCRWPVAEQFLLARHHVQEQKVGKKREYKMKGMHNESKKRKGKQMQKGIVKRNDG